MAHKQAVRIVFLEDQLELKPGGIESQEAFGQPLIITEQKLYPSGIASEETFGQPVVNQYILPSSISSDELFGTPSVGYGIVLSGIPSEESFGSPLFKYDQWIYPSGIPTGELSGGHLIKVFERFPDKYYRLIIPAVTGLRFGLKKLSEKANEEVYLKSKFALTPKKMVVPIEEEIVVKEKDLYFGTWTWPGRVVKVDYNLEESESLSAPEGYDLFFAAVAVCDEGYVYFGGMSGETSGVIMKLDLLTFDWVGQLEVGAGVLSGVIDYDKNIAYFGTKTNRVYKVDLENFSVVGWVEIPDELIQNLRVALIDDNYAYFYGAKYFWDKTIGVLWRLNLNSFTFDSSLVFNETGNFPPGSGIIVDGYGCIASGQCGAPDGEPPARIWKVNLANFSVVDTLELPYYEGYLMAAIADGEYAYFGGRVFVSSFTGKLYKVRLTDLEIEDSFLLTEGKNYPGCAAIDMDEGYAYFGTLDSPGEVVKVKIPDLVIVGNLVLEQEDDALISVVICPRRSDYERTGGGGVD